MMVPTGGRARLGAVVLVLVMAMVPWRVVDAAPSAGASTADTGRLIPLTPCRLLDTRDSGTPTAPNTTLTVAVTDRCGVPAAAVAVVVTLTAVQPPQPGWFAVTPAGSPPARTSSLNVDTGQVRASTVTVPLGVDGSLTVTADAGGHVLMDVSGAFVPATSARAGRLVTVEPVRLLDSRGDGWAGGERTIRVPLPAGVPSDAIALVLNVTVAGSGSTSGGFVTAHAWGTPRPNASILNTDGWAQVRAGATIVPTSAEGVALYTSVGDPLVVDLAGYFTGDGADESGEGLLVPVTPLRLADTRSAGPALGRAATREWPVALGGVEPDRVGAVVATVTMVDPRRDGWIVAHAARTPRPEVSSVNAVVHEVAANMVISRVSTAGIALYAEQGGDVLIDVTGWFTGSPVPAVLPPPTGGSGGPGHTLVISDSTGAAMRWYPEALAHLTGTEFSIDLESCRRTIGMSCRGREGRVPSTTVEAVRAAPPGIGTVVIMTGYNDRPDDFRRGVDEVVAAAVERGIEQVVWLTLRTNTTYSMPGQPGSSANDYQWGNLALSLAERRHPQLDLIDWNMYSHLRDPWFFPDGAHLSALGAVALAQFISAELERLHG